jgi:anaerobic selenocysteine-containing dehydrogenase
MSTPGVVHVEEQGATADPAPAAAEATAEAESDAASEVDDAEATDEPTPAPEPAAARPALLTWDPSTITPTPGPKADAYKLRLVAGRKLYDAGVMLSMAPSLAPLAAPPVLRVHPTDLERLGVASGGTVRLRSNKVTVDAIEVVADPFQPRGTAGLPFNVPGVDTRALLDVTAPVAEVAMETR